MPEAQTILDGLGATANAWMPLAVLWHVYFAVLAALLLKGFRPNRRIMAILLSAPLASVALLAGLSGNPFNGTVFALGAVGLAGIGIAQRPLTVETADKLTVVIGSLFFGFGWLYPHFIETDSWLVYTYAAPTGLVPCPTLSIVTGLAITLNGLSSTTWSLVLGGLGLFYGIFGAMILGVTMDWVLAAAALCLGVQAFANRMRSG